MGVSMNISVGVFVRIKLEPTNYEAIVVGCPKIACREYAKLSSHNFCAVCGTKVGEHTVQRTGVRDWFQFAEEVGDSKYEDDLYAPEYAGSNEEQILFSNYVCFDTDFDGDGGILSLNNISDRIAKDTLAFHERHGEMIKEMKEFFGENLVIDYGVCSYWN